MAGRDADLMERLAKRLAMGLFRRVCMVLATTALAVAPAAAQFGGIFGEPPRPPSSVPSRPPAPPADDRYPDQRRPARQYPDPAPQQYPPPPPQYPGAAANTGPAVGPPPSATGPGGIQSQTLAPPPGIPPAPAAPSSGPAGQQVLRPQQANVPPQANAPAANAPTQPGDEVVTAPPAEKIVNPTAVFSGLDKITGRITSFDVSINETVQFGALQVTPRACYTRPLTQTQNTDSFVEVDEVTLQGEVKRIFTGWMFAASPGLHAVEHPIYDVWLTDCKGGAPPQPPVAQVQPSPAPARPAAAPKAPQRPVAPARPGPPR